MNVPFPLKLHIILSIDPLHYNKNYYYQKPHLIQYTVSKIEKNYAEISIMA